MSHSGDAPSDDIRTERIAVMSAVLADRFGDAAEDVARAQVAAASGDIKATWIEILSTLEGRARPL